MVIVYKSNKKGGVMRKSLALILFIIILFTHVSNLISVLNFSSERVDNQSKIDALDAHVLSHAQDPVNDTTKPAIGFINPMLDNTIVSQKSYEIIVNITDDNPPLLGDVIIQISNDSAWFFNASMSSIINNVWSFNWNNLTSYENQANYSIRVWAMDSSPNANYGWSEEYYIFLSIQKSPGIFSIIIYIIAVVIILALIMLYLNRKALNISIRRNRKKDKGEFED